MTHVSSSRRLHLAIETSEGSRGADDMRTFLGGLFRVMPLLFGLGFLGPLFAQVLTMAGWTPPMGLAPLAIGMAVGGVWGGVATLTGRWL